MKAVSMFLVAMLLLVIAITTFVAIEFPSSLVLQMNQESYITLKFGTTALAESSKILACDGCSGGGGTGG